MELKKPVSIIEVSNNVTTVQRMAYNVIMKHFCHSEPLDDIGTRAIGVGDLCRIMNYEKKDFFYLDEQLEKLQSTTIKWMGDDSSDFQRVNFFSYTSVKDGVFYYRYDPFLQSHISSKKTIFALLDIRSMGVLKKRHSLPLYEFCARFRPNKKRQYESGTPWVELGDLKELLTGNVASYKVWQDFKKRVLEPSVKEVNKNTDIILTVEIRRRKRSVVAVKFGVSDKEEVVEKSKLKGFEKPPTDDSYVEAEYVKDPMFSDELGEAADISKEALGEFFGDTFDTKKGVDPEPRMLKQAAEIFKDFLDVGVITEKQYEEFIADLP